MSSLRTKLLVTVWIAIVAIGGLCVAITYQVARHETEELLDGQMQRVAHIVAARQAGQQATDLPTAELPAGYETEDDLVVVIRDDRGTVVYRSSDDLDLPAASALGFGTASLAGQTYQLFAMRSGAQVITVAQSTEVRRESAAGAALAALLPIVIILPTVGLLITLVVRSQLRPISRTAQAIAERPPLALDPLPTDALPREVRPLVDEINQLLSRQREAIVREQQFLSDAAHALRTPLTALQLQVDVLNGSNEPEERERRYAELRAGIRRVVRLTGQLLALAREQSGDSSTEERTPLMPAIADVHAVYAMVAAERGIGLTSTNALDAQVRGNHHQLILILGNLLDNALRYTRREGAVEIQTSRTEGSVTIDIRDEGPGLPPDELERVFERFYRTPNDGTRGNGLGLATVRTLVQQIGGRVWLENRPDRPGLVARVRLPT